MLTLNDGRKELWQWDTGRKLTVDADCSQVHFSNKVFGRSIDVDVVDGTVAIPDVLLQVDNELIAWAFVGTPENGYTKISKVFKVNKRNKPADYVFTPPEQTTLGQIMKRLDRIEESQDPDAIKNAVDDYLANNPIQIDETDPTVPAWAKQATKPKYTAAEVGAVATVNGVKPDANGNVEITIQGSGGNVDLTGVVRSVNGKTPDANGNVEIAVSGGNGVTVTPYCSFQNRGVLFKHPEPYTAWAKNLRYDSKRKKFVCLVNVDTKHDGDATNDIFFYFVHINAETLHYYDLKQIEPVHSDGTPYVFGTDEFAYSCSFWIDSEFNYWFWTKSQALFKSEDGGYTWVYQKQMVNPYAEYITNSDTGATALSSLYGLTILSNGRYFCSKGGSSKNLYYSDNEGESWAEVTINTPNALKFFEVEFIEGKNGKVLAIGRATTQVTEGAEINDTLQKPALFAVSDDYGSTWGTAFISKSVNDMNANNCTHFIDKNGVVHLVWCSRRRSDEKIVDSFGIERFGVMYYSYANSFDDACMDNFCDARIIGYSQATTENSQSEYGYPSIAVTDDGLMMYVYSDTEDPAVGGVPTYFYGIANKYAYMSPINDTDITVYSAFSTKKVTELLALQKTELMAHITELYSKIGELPPVTEMDGSMYVTDGLIDCWAVQDLAAWDTSSSTAKITGAKGNTMSARSDYSVFKANDNGTALVDYITDSVFSDMVTLGDEMTIEAVLYNVGMHTALTITTGNPDTQLVSLSSSFTWNGVSGTRLFSPNFTKVTGGGECKHFILTVKDKCLTVWINGVKTNTHGPDDAYVPVDGYLRFNYANGSIAGRDMGHGDIRFYNKALSDEEIQNNYLYAASRFTLTKN